MPRTLYALCGLPFAGKSTVAATLAQRTGAALVRLDAINHERGLGLDGAPISADEWRRTYAEAYRRVEQDLASGRSVVFDHGNFDRAERDRVRALGRQTGAQVRFIHVAISPHEARRRLLANRQRRERYDVRDDDFELAVQMFESPEGEADVITIEALGDEPR
jgi:predicted kinase